MAFVSDREDMCSMGLTVVRHLMEKNSIDYKDIGRLEVGTESSLDRSKSIKTYLMQLFMEAGNTEIEGIDNINACYGGTSALFNCINWIESSNWDGRLAIVVAGDVAVYAPGPARPTGGCGCVAVLIGPNAPLAIEPGMRGVHMEHAYDFYKPVMDSEYPVVDGRLSITCYLRALDLCYQRYKLKFQEKAGKKYSRKDVDYFIFHSPYLKLVQKSFGRLVYNDFLEDPDHPDYVSVRNFAEISRESSMENRDLEQAFVGLTKEEYSQKVQPGATLSKEMGNMYTGSTFAALAYLIASLGDESIGKRVALFSYGSGLAASLFSMKIRGNLSKFKLNANFDKRLSQRTRVTPENFSEILLAREKTFSKGDFTPCGEISILFPGTYYLDRVDSLYRRYYKYYSP
eukprot:TRINITY_DN3823_c0_g1_i1.p1 TRINITY_DN3823_c0_g1~~TRINITY_DN3823_c0_g1_i1.p1  ORF type:complete len:401 (-),score=132.20 TRINITY_DN3823_c0_g1_i1:42-1244(-)